MTIDATGVSTVGEPTTLTIAYDTTGARSKIDEFVGAYNSLVDNLRALVAGLDRAQLRADVGLPALDR